MNAATVATTTLKTIVSGNDVASRPRPTNFPAMLEAYKGEIARALPRHLNADTMTRIALTCFRMTPKLAECQPASVFACVIQASQLGLRPGLMGECYLIPYKDQCTLQLGYQGLLELVRRSGLVDSISAHLVHDRDEFDVSWGTEPGIKHRPYLDGDPGGVRLVYAVARLKGGGVHAELMTLHDIERIKARSQNVINAARWGKQTPWDTDWGEMARKTVLRRICKYLPKSPDLASALAIDDAAFRGKQQLTMQDAIANTFVPPPMSLDDPDPTGEVDPPAPPPPPPPAPPDAPAPRTRTARPRKGGGGGTAVEEPADQQQQELQADDGPPPRSYSAFASDISNASDAETAALALDEARGSGLDPQELDDLAALYRREWVNGDDTA
jgi:recombination protein RecT